MKEPVTVALTVKRTLTVPGSAPVAWPSSSSSEPEVPLRRRCASSVTLSVRAVLAVGAVAACVALAPMRLAPIARAITAMLLVVCHADEPLRSVG